jgi:hypothetical protein
MANNFFRGEKAPQDEARAALMELIADNWTGAFTVDFWSDDGGAMIRAVLELADPNSMLEQEFRSKFDAMWMGWRLIVLKVPLGHIAVFHNP